MSNPQKRLTPEQYARIREHYSDDEIRQRGYDLPDADFSDVESGSSSVAPKKPSALGAIKRGAGHVIREVGQGATMGFLDEAMNVAERVDPPSIVRRIATGKWGNPGDKLRKESEEFRESMPKTALALNVAGGLATPGGVAKTLISKGLPRALAGASATGAIGAGLTAAGETDGTAGERLTNAAIAAPFGAAGGGLMGALVARGAPHIVRGGQKAWSAVTGKEAAPKASGKALRTVGKYVDRSGKSFDEITQRLDAPEAREANLMLADELPELAEGVATLPGKGATKIREAVKARGKGRSAREGAAIEDALGTKGKTVMQTGKALDKAQNDASSPLYEKSYTYPNTKDERLAILQESPDIREALAKGAKRVQNVRATERAKSGVKAPPRIEIPNTENNAALLQNPKVVAAYKKQNGLPDNAEIVLKGNAADEGYSIQHLDLAKRSMDAKINKLIAHENWDEARELVALRGQLVQVADDATEGTFKAARDAWADPESVRDAMKLGQKALKMRDDDLLVFTADLNPAQREGFAIGLTDAAQKNPGFARRIVGEGADADVRRNVLKAAMGDEPFARLLKNLESEAKGAETKYLTTGNSRTAQRQELHQDLTGGLIQNAVEAGRHRPTLTGIANRWGADALKRRATAWTEGGRNKIADELLSKPGDPQYQALMRALAERERIRPVGRAAGRGAGAATGRLTSGR